MKNCSKFNVHNEIKEDNRDSESSRGLRLAKKGLGKLDIDVCWTTILSFLTKQEIIILGKFFSQNEAEQVSSSKVLKILVLSYFDMLDFTIRLHTSEEYRESVDMERRLKVGLASMDNSIPSSKWIDIIEDVYDVDKKCRALENPDELCNGPNLMQSILQYFQGNAWLIRSCSSRARIA